jgi:hypothetical protein
MFKKERYNCIPNDTVWRVLRKRLHFKAYTYKRFRTTRHTAHLEYHCKTLFETLCITSESRIEP